MFRRFEAQAQLFMQAFLVCIFAKMINDKSLDFLSLSFSVFTPYHHGLHSKQATLSGKMPFPGLEWKR